MYRSMRRLLLISTIFGLAFACFNAWFLGDLSQAITNCTRTNGARFTGRNDKHVRPGAPLALTELASSDQQVTCPEGHQAVYDTVLDSSRAYEGGRKIPKVVHVTSKSRCMHPAFAQNIDKWRFEGYSLFMHDDEAMEKLLYREWPEFPHLHKLMQCLEFGGAVKADIWRLLVLYEYGGVFT
jgi:mannosyltransferase OCH1-like enzyme